MYRNTYIFYFWCVHENSFHRGLLWRRGPAPYLRLLKSASEVGPPNLHQTTRVATLLSNRVRQMAIESIPIFSSQKKIIKNYRNITRVHHSFCWILRGLKRGIRCISQYFGSKNVLLKGKTLQPIICQNEKSKPISDACSYDVSPRSLKRVVYITTLRHITGPSQSSIFSISKKTNFG